MNHDGIKIEAVRKTFGDVEAIKGITLDVPAESFTTIVGPSGSGKTTLLRMIAGFEQPSSGRILIHGKDSTDLPPRKRNLGMVFQHYALFPHLNVAQNLEYPLKVRHVATQERAALVDEYLDLVELSSHRSHFPHQLSGGQQQRVALARALVYRPRLLLLDEPLGALDKRLRRAMQQELKELHTRLGIAFIYVTHDQGEALALSTNLVVMHDGQVDQSGPPQEVYQAPRTLFVGTFMGDSNLIDCIVEEVGPHEVLVRLDNGAEVVLPADRLSGAFAVGEHAVLFLRPEAAKLLPRNGDDLEPDTNRTIVLDAALRHGTFMGDYHDLILETEVGQILVRTRTQSSPGDRFPIQASWSAADGRLFPRR